MTRLQIRRGTTAEWAAAGAVVLAAGEPGLDTTTKTQKMGDGVTAWGSLVPDAKVTTITAGAGLTGGGDTSADRTMAVNFAGSGAATTAARSDHQHVSQAFYQSGVGGISIPSTTPVSIITSGNLILPAGNNLCIVNASCLAGMSAGTALQARFEVLGLPEQWFQEAAWTVASGSGRQSVARPWVGVLTGTVNINYRAFRSVGTSGNTVDIAQAALSVTILGQV